ncbi:putative toxin [Candidatus Burkholderia verschuerenii]|uniref:Putative toxin n=1 Tax=Candidatus Burkholderia verschuerenii TaxID=242163 RepID=A0A0L0MAS4_9BURK|nr:type II toxin-antitoxin system RelE/ParE family toxin [Candidatus Burkholderia verschuerenii]KND59380.1 putative toxin [Candidatus Burkholderia verschuerenii]
MITFVLSPEFSTWLEGIRDRRAKARISVRIASARAGNFSDCEPIGEGVSEMRIDVGAGYRVYFTRQDTVVYVLLMGGDKSSQKRDIKRALQMARALKASLL